MARTFDGSDDNLRTSMSTALQNITFGTYAAIVRRNSTGWNGILVLHNSSGTARAGMEIEDNGDGNGIAYLSDASYVASATVTLVNADGWCLIAATKPTGTSAVTFHKYVYSSNTWTHTAGSSIANNTAPGSGGTARFGQWETTDFLGGDLAAAGVWARALSDAEVEQLAYSLTGWYAAAPDALWVFDQQATSQKLLDLTGGGANESAITGTSVATTSVPIFGYGHPVVLATSAAGGAATNANAEAATYAVAASDATTSVAPAADGVALGVAAGDATTTVAPSVDAAALSVTADAATASVAPVAEVAAATIAAADATVTTGTVAAAEVAALAVVAADATTTVAAGADVAALTVAGNDATTTAAPNVDYAAATFVAGDATVLTGTVVPADAATLTVSALDATTGVAPAAELAAAELAAADASTRAAPTVDVAALTVAGNDAQPAVAAGAESASGLVAAGDATTTVAVNAQCATVGVAADDSTAAVAAAAAAECATILVTVDAAALRIAATAEAAAILAAALDATVTGGSAPGAITTRPNTGTTTRPQAGTTARPYSGITTRP